MARVMNFATGTKTDMAVALANAGFAVSEQAGRIDEEIRLCDDEKETVDSALEKDGNGENGRTFSVYRASDPVQRGEPKTFTTVEELRELSLSAGRPLIVDFVRREIVIYDDWVE